MKQILIRADDLGFSTGVNQGIEKTLQNGLVKSVGLMTNMDEAENGVRMVRQYDVCIGQHTNICVGKPLTDPKLIPSICQENGEFKSSKEYRMAKMEGREIVNLDEVILEIEAQYQRFKMLTGTEPAYFEGHAVSSDNFFKGLEIVAHRHNLPYLEMKIGKPVVFRHTVLNSHMPGDFKAYEDNPFIVIEDAVRGAKDGECEMMVFHPGYLDSYLLSHSSMTKIREKECEMLCSRAAKDWLDQQDIRQVTYKDLYEEE